MTNVLSIDVEDYFMVTALEQGVKRSEWDKYESRVERNTHRLLEILSHAPTWSSSPPGASPSRLQNGKRKALHATFFCLGWVAERFPRLIKEIADCGHEIACHGYDHRRIHSMFPPAFREDIRRSRALLEDCAGQRVIGYRAPSYSITPDCLWAFEILAQEGFLYDSSLFPVKHDLYGFPDAPRFPSFLVQGSRGIKFVPLRSKTEPSDAKLLFEFPPSTLRLFGQNVPVAGGGYFRLFPMFFTRWAIRRLQKEDLPFIFYLHPWEIDPGQPRVNGIPLKSRFRHYLNLDRTEDRLKSLLRRVPFYSFRDFIEEQNLLATRIQRHKEGKSNKLGAVQ